VIDPDVPALTRGRLAHVDQFYVRAATHATANAILVERATGASGAPTCPMGPSTTTAPLEAIAQQKVTLKQIVTQWPDMLRVVGSLITNQVRAYDLLRMFSRNGRHAVELSLPGRDRDLPACHRPPDQRSPIDDADVARLSPLGHAHLNVLVRYAFTASQPPAPSVTPLWGVIDPEDPGEP
jgi:hypothetical protein